MARNGETSLSGKVVVITGASSGIGLETAKAFAAEGCRVALGARREDELDDARRQVEQAGGEALTQVADVQDEAQVRALVGAARGRWGRVDILVNNAGFGMLKPFADTTTDEVREQMETNYFGAVYATKAALEDMLARKDGHIINVASIAAKLPQPGFSGYAPTKAALDSFSGVLRAELHDQHIKVTAVHPGPTNTGFFPKSVSDDPEKKQQVEGAQRRFGRFAMQQPDKVAQAIVRAAKQPKPEVYPMPGTQLLPVMRTLLGPAVRLALRGMARIYR